MKKRNFILTLLITVAAVFAFAASAPLATPTPAKAKKKKNAAQPMTQLPAAKSTQTKISVDFSNDASSNVVIVNEAPDSVQEALAKSESDVKAEESAPLPLKAKSSSRTKKSSKAMATASPSVGTSSGSTVSAADTSDSPSQKPLLETKSAPLAPPVVEVLPLPEKSEPVPTPVFENPKVSSDVIVINEAPPVTPVSGVASSHSQLKPNKAEPGDSTQKRILLRGGYVDAHYDRVASDLKNGATTMGASVAFEHDFYDLQYGLDLLHGLDQTISLANTRTTILHVDALHRFNSDSKALMTWFAGLGIGAADVAVRSYRATSSGDIVLREHERGTFLALIPQGGLRFNTDLLSIDLNLQYLSLMGSDASGLGGFTTGVAVGLPF